VISIRRSPETTPNEALKEMPAGAGEANLAWLQRVGFNDGIVLFGGSSLAHFRVRVAQSHLRNDMLPSFWSLVGILWGNGSFVSAPLEFSDDTSSIPACNGVRICRLADYDDPARFPNVAALRFADDHAPVRAHVAAIRNGRSIIDLPSLILPWLAFIWGAGGARNPLLEGSGLPSAAFVETVCGMAGIELTPGLSSASSCPEAIWQSAKWWHGFYESADAAPGGGQAAPMVPQGAFTTRQPAAAVAVESATWQSAGDL
jgi:hypothetical protein